MSAPRQPAEHSARSNKRLLLQQISLFADLTDEQLDFVADRSRLDEFDKGQTIYTRGDKPDSFYGLVSGRVRIYGGAPDQAQREILEVLHRGDYFGMISILTNEPHSVTAEVVNDSILFRIQRPDFEAILKEIPAVAVHLSTTLSRRLRQKDLGEKKIFESTLISIYSPLKGTGRTMYGINLASSLHRETGKKVILLDMSPAGDAVCQAMERPKCPTPLKLKGVRFNQDQVALAIAHHPEVGFDTLNIAHDPNVASDVTQITPLLSYLANSYHFVISDLPHEMDRTVFKALAQADLIHLVSTGARAQLHTTADVLEDLKKTVQMVDERVKVVVNESTANTDQAERTLILNRKVYATLPRVDATPAPGHPIVSAHPNWEYAQSVRRIAREIGEVLVGLVLGSGAALGLAHIGILRILEREKIPIDIIAGSSMGALIGTLWASGLSSNQIEEIASNFKTKASLLQLIDLTIPKFGIFTGRRITKFLANEFEDMTFRDLKLPMKVVACDYVRREVVVLDEGPVVPAIRASVSIPGIFEPVKINHRWLIDGGVLDPVPVDTLAQMGVHKIIAVNTLPSPTDIRRKQVEGAAEWGEIRRQAQRKGLLHALLFQMRLAFRNWRDPNILDVIMHSMQAMEYELAEAACAQADVALHPTIPRINWWEFYNVDELIEEGTRRAEAHLDEIKRLVSE